IYCCRHVGLVYGLVETLLLPAAGLGLERLWTLRLRRPSNPVLLIAGAAVLVELSGALPRLARGSPFGQVWYLVWTDLVFVRILAYGALAGAGRLAWLPLPAALAVGLAFDLGVYQLAVHRFGIQPLAPQARGLLLASEVTPLGYQPERLESPDELGGAAGRSRAQERSRRALELVNRLGATPTRLPTEQAPFRSVHTIAYGFAQFDPCRNEHLDYIRLSRAHRLLRLEERL